MKSFPEVWRGEKRGREVGTGKRKQRFACCPLLVPGLSCADLIPRRPILQIKS